jgi:CP family cyanate transporter-like MFS transporter
MLAEPEEVAHLTGATLSLGYTLAFAGPPLGGSLLDVLHLPAVAFVPVALAGILLILLGGALPTHTAARPGASAVAGQDIGADTRRRGPEQQRVV